MSTRGATRALGLLLIVASTLVACGDANEDKLGGTIRTPALQVGAVRVSDDSRGADGAPFAMKAQRGGVLLVYFGYTSCPDLCPTTLADIGHAIKQLPKKDRSRVSVALVTIDPERDTADVMNSYLDHFVAGGHALRPVDESQQAAAQRAFNVTAKRVEEGDTYSFEHSGTTYGVDEHGTVVVEWPFGLGSTVLHRDLVLLLARNLDKGAMT